MRTTPIAPGEYYHVFNRGNNKQQIFLDNRDWIRFLFLILHLQSPTTFFNMSRDVNYYVKHSVFNIAEDEIYEIVKNRTVELISFCLMPNHFHLILKEFSEAGISQYMQRILNGFTKYFNTKYKKSGHLFQGPYKIVHVEDNEQLLHLSSYIHRNPRELKQWRQRENEYPWSSHQDYYDENRWGPLLSQSIILDQFEDKNEYHQFMKTSTAKLLDTECLTLKLE